MKELRPTVKRIEWRVAFAFDVKRQAIVLAALAKGGKKSSLVYARLIKLADARFEEHQALLEKAEKEKKRERVMPVSFEDILKEFTPEERAEIDRGADAIATASRTLAELRKSNRLTQKQLAKSLKMSQANISEIESKGDAVLVSTVERVVRGIGGKLALYAEMRDGKRVRLRLGKLKAKGVAPKMPKAASKPKALPLKKTKTTTRRKAARSAA